MRLQINIMSFISAMLVFISVLPAFSQSPEEKALFDTINVYRKKLHLSTLIWDTTLYKVATHHSEYICIINSEPYNKGILTHDEAIEVGGFKNLGDFSDRVDYYFGKNRNFKCLENCALSPATWFRIDTVKLTKIISGNLLKGWIKSAEHHKILKSKNASCGACSIRYYQMTIQYKDQLGNTKKSYIKIACATFDIH